MFDFYRLIDNIFLDDGLMSVPDDEFQSLLEYGANCKEHGDLVEALCAILIPACADRSGCGVNAQFFYWRALLRESEGRYEKALADFEQAASDEEFDLDYLCKVGEMSMRLGQREKAMNVCKNLCSLGSDRGVAPKEVGEKISRIILADPAIPAMRSRLRSACAHNLSE